MKECKDKHKDWIGDDFVERDKGEREFKLKGCLTRIAAEAVRQSSENLSLFLFRI